MLQASQRPLRAAIQDVLVTEYRLSSMQALDRQQWLPNSRDCAVCSFKFTLRDRAHHCRACGACVCDSCSRGRLMMRPPHKGASKFSGCGSRMCQTAEVDEDARKAHPERVCDNCISNCELAIGLNDQVEALFPILFKALGVTPIEVSRLLPRVSRSSRQAFMRGMAQHVLEP